MNELHNVVKLSINEAIQKGYVKYRLQHLDPVKKSSHPYVSLNGVVDEICDQKENIFTLKAEFLHRMEDQEKRGHTSQEKYLNEFIDSLQSNMYEKVKNKRKQLRLMYPNNKNRYFFNALVNKNEKKSRDLLKKIEDFTSSHSLHDIDVRRMISMNNEESVLMVGVIEKPLYAVKIIDFGICYRYELKKKDPDVTEIFSFIPEHVGFLDSDGVGFPTYDGKSLKGNALCFTPYYYSSSFFGEIAVSNDEYLIFDDKEKALNYVNKSLDKIQSIVDKTKAKIDHFTNQEQ